MLGIYLLILLVLFASILLYFRIADYYDIIDKPNQRSSHTQITLRGGGIIFYIGVLLWFVVFGFQQPYFFAGLTLIAGISFLDDLKPLASKVRLIVHVIALLLMFYQWGLLGMPWYFILLALTMGVGIINAYNFMDGINGITGGYSIVVVGALWYINNYQVAFVNNDLIYVVLLSLFVFCLFNFRNRAKCFAGDVGSVGMAFIVLFMLGCLIIRTEDLSYLVLLAVYGVDSLLTIIHRITLRENILEAHRKHVFQLMANELKIPHIGVTLIYMAIQALVIIGFIWCYGYGYWYFFSVIIVLGGVYLMFMKKYFHLHQY